MADHELEFTDATAIADSVDPNAAPRMSLIQPLPGATGVSPSTPIVLQLSAGVGHAAMLESVVIVVNGLTVWEGAEPKNRWNAVTEADGENYYYQLYPPSGFSYGATVAIETTFHQVVQIAKMYDHTVAIAESWNLVLDASTPGYFGLYGVLTGAPVFAEIGDSVTLSGGQ